MKINHGESNYKWIKPFLLGADANEGHFRYTSEGYEPLSVENLEYTDYLGNPVYSIAHFYLQNGDLMRDPDMEIAVNDTLGIAYPLTYQLDALGIYQEVFVSTEKYRPKLLNELSDFLNDWGKNIKSQGFKAEQAYAEIIKNA